MASRNRYNNKFTCYKFTTINKTYDTIRREANKPTTTSEARRGEEKGTAGKEKLKKEKCTIFHEPVIRIMKSVRVQI